jgi:hypothetical protein
MLEAVYTCIGMASIRVYCEYVHCYGYTCHDWICCFVDVCIRRRAASSVMFSSIWNNGVFGAAAGRGAFGELVYCFQSILGILFGSWTAGKAGIIE